MKNMYQRLSWSLCCLLCFINIAVWGQQNFEAPRLPDIILPSPQVAQFARYGEIPVGHTTGVPQIEVPIYTLSTGWIDIPISLSYHSSGFQVNDIPSPVGLGWVLNAGGFYISRQVESKPDFEGGYTREITSAAQVDSVKNGTSSVLDLSSHGHWMYWEQFFFSKNPLANTRSDRYFYAYPGGGNGVARYDMATRELLPIPYAPIQIKRINQDCYRITDTRGIIYEYTEKELVTISGRSGDKVTSGWYLTKIVYPGMENDPVVFSYKKGIAYHQISRSHTVSIVDGRNAPSGNCFEMIGGPKSDLIGPQINSSSSTYESPLIEKITWKDVRIDFVYASDRSDQRKDRLTTVTVSHGNQRIKRVQLDNQVYFGTGVQNYRLKLKGVTVMGNDADTAGQRYGFNYYDENEPAPDYYAYTGAPFREDYWGYFNGASSFSSIPRHTDWKRAVGLTNLQNFGPFQEWNRIVSDIYIKGYVTDRSPYLTFMRRFVLKEIVYPTRGKSVLEYEINKVPDAYEFNDSINVGGLRIKKRINYTGENTVAEVKTYEYEGFATERIMNNHYARIITAFDYIACLYVLNPDRYSFTKIAYPIYYFDGGAYTSLTNWTGSNVFYRKVTEYAGEKSNHEGFTEYYYAEESRQFNTECNFNLEEYRSDMISKISDCDKGYMKGLLLGCISYDTTGNEVKKVANQYNYYILPNIHTGVRVLQNALYPMNWFHSDGQSFQARLDMSAPYQQEEYWTNYLDYIRAFDTYAFRDIMLLSATVETDYVNGQPAIKKTTTYGYDTDGNGYPVILNPSRTTTTSSTGKVSKQTIKRPYHTEYENTDPYVSMLAKHILEPVVETRDSVDNTLMQITKTNYYNPPNTGLFVPLSLQVQSGANPMETRIRYHSHDRHGNPTQVSLENGPNISYLWGYNGLYPIAKIENIAYNEVAYTSFEDNNNGSNWSYSSSTVSNTYSRTGEKSCTLGSGYISSTGLTTGKTYILSYWSRSGPVNLLTASLYTAIANTFKTGKIINNWTYYEHTFTMPSSGVAISGNGKTIDDLCVYPVGTVMTTYTYQPLLGISSETDPSGRTVYYQYDNAGRLWHVKDEDGMILTEHKYHYAP